MPDLDVATILCDKRTVTINSLDGAGVNDNEADDGCLKDLTESSTAWFTWEAATNGNLSFTIQPLNGGDRLSFILFELPDGLRDGTNKVPRRCTQPCRTGAVGLRAGDNDFNIDDCATAADGFMRPLAMQEGFFYALMVDNSTSSSGFTIEFGGTGELVGPIGNILPSDQTACFGKEIIFDNDVTFSNGTITRYDWLFEDGDVTSTSTVQLDVDQSFNYTSVGEKFVELVVTTNIGCTATFETNITIEDCCDTDNAVTITNDEVADIRCPGDTNGQIDLTVSSIFPVNFEWENGTPFTEDNPSKDVYTATATGLTSETYSVTVTNDASCRDSFTYTFVSPSDLEAEETVVNPNCGQSDGQITITATGGTAPYSYNFGDGNFITENSLNGLDTGDYDLVVRDASGCETPIIPAELDEKQLEIALEDFGDPTCADRTDGFVTISATNATGNLSFDINATGIVDASALTTLDSGSYIIDVFDEDGCTGNPVEVTLSKPEAFSSIIIETGRGISCTDANDGTAIVTVSGGTPDYNYRWSNGETTRSISGLGPGTYTVIITDANGCTIEESSSELVNPEPLVATISNVENATCGNRNDGSVDLAISGGIMPYKYSTDGVSFEAGSTVTDLGVGDYEIIVTDNNDCPATVEASIVSPANLSFEVGSATDICYGEMISFTNTSTFSRGTITDISWDFGDTTATGETPEIRFTNIGNPTVSLTVTSDLDCAETISQTLDIAVNPCCDINGVSTFPFFEEPLCAEEATGSINLNINSEPPITSIAWDNGAMTEEILDLPAGRYAVVVTNDATCQDAFEVTLEAPEPVTATIDIANPSCDAASNGAISVTGAGGVEGTAYEYDFGTGFSGVNTLNDLPIGDYDIMIRDDNNCMVSAIASLMVPVGSNPIDATLTVVNPSCEEAANGSISVVATGVGAGAGNTNFEYNFGTTFTTDNFSSGLTTGNYAVVIRDEDNCTRTLDTTLSVSPDAMPVTAILNVTNPSCGGGADGVITVLPDGELGTNPDNYAYDFGSGFTDNSTNASLTAGSYQITVRNSDNCSIVVDTQLSELVLEPTSLVTRPSCFGLSDGSIRFDIPNGVGPFEYDFGDGNGFQAATALDNLGKDTYTIRVQDAEFCLSEPIEVVVDEPDSLVVSLNKTDISCFGENDGRIIAEVSGGVGNYQYNWSNGQINNVVSNLTPNDYSVAVLDGNDCPASSEVVTVVEPDELFAAIGQVNDVLCFGETNGAITVEATGGNAPFEYSLDGILFQPSPTLGELAAGDYNVVVRDANGCQDETEVASIQEPNEFLITANSDTDVAKLGFTINLSAEANSNDGGINYVWTTPDSVVCVGCQQFETIPPGSTTYTVTATNAANCQATAQVSVGVTTDRPVYIPNIFSPNGDGVNDEFFIPFTPAISSIEYLRIYDRVGTLLFEALDIQPGEERLKAWDGRFNGEEIRQGVFVVTAEINFVDRKAFPYNSDVTLISSE